MKDNFTATVLREMQNAFAAKLAKAMYEPSAITNLIRGVVPTYNFVCPTLWVCSKTGIGIEVRSTFLRLLNDDCLSNIVQIQCGYGMMNDEYEFMVQRRSDQLMAKFTVPRYLLGGDVDDDTVVAAFRREADQLAKLILFLS